MKKIFSGDEWTITQEGFDDRYSLFSESIFSLSNGYMGGRGNFEEGYGGKTLKSFFHAGVYYPDKAQYGWYKVGYPLKNNKVINSPCLIGIKIKINDSNMDLFSNKFTDFKRTLNMKNGLLERSFIYFDSHGHSFEVKTRRFLSMKTKNLIALSFSIRPLDCETYVEFEPYIDGNVTNTDAIESECFWKSSFIDEESLEVITIDNSFNIVSSMAVKVFLGEKPLELEYSPVKKDKYTGQNYKVKLQKKEILRIEKYVVSFNSRKHDRENLLSLTKEKISDTVKKDFNILLKNSEKEWEKIWQKIDMKIEGDIYAQQAMRFNLFMLNSTYTGEDDTLNISPKGFTGEMYNGSTYWDTEIYCLPYFLYLDSNTAKNLLLYRYNFLKQAINNARLLMLKGALYPMITIDGNEGHAEWEITLMEIHRNSAVAFSIYNYIRATGDYEYMKHYGFEVLANIALFWADRVTYNENKKMYTILGVTGPDEFHNNINNNWYTNLMAKWTLDYAYKQAIWLKDKDKINFNSICEKYTISDEAIKKWKHISENIFLGRKGNIFVQFDGFCEKEHLTVFDVPQDNLPVAQHWSWDRINRVSLIKQADVILGLYLLSEDFSLEEKKENFYFYEKKTLHESSLSPSIYSIVASEIGAPDKAYEMFLKSALFDLEDINSNTEYGLHITSMGGTCLSVIEGFMGIRIRDGKLHLSPRLPASWKSLDISINFRERLLSICVSGPKLTVRLIEGDAIEIHFDQKGFTVDKEKIFEASLDSVNG